MNTSTSKSNRQNLISRSKSQKSHNKSFKSPIKEANSKQSLNNTQQKKVKLSQQSLINKMRTIRQKLCQTLDAYILILETHAPFRCLQHNSILSLYCQTQQKLLCANCVYRTNTHKLHRVFPLEKCYKQIARDVDQLTRQVQRQIQWAQGSIKSIIEFFNEQQKNTNQAILILTQKYDELHIELEKSFQQAKKKLLVGMNTELAKKQSIQLQIQFFRNILGSNKPTLVQNIPSQDANVTQSYLIFNHLIGSALVEYGKMQGVRVVQGMSKVKQIQRKQTQKINQIGQVIESWKNLDRERIINEEIDKSKQKQKQRYAKLQVEQLAKQFDKQKLKSPSQRKKQPKIIN